LVDGHCHQLNSSSPLTRFWFSMFVD
jgi:hypothetical protein